MHRFDGKIFEGHVAHAFVRMDTPSHDEGELCEEPLDERGRKVVAETEGIDPYDSTDPGESRLVVGERFAPGGDPEHLDLAKMAAEQFFEFVRFVLVDVERILAVREGGVGRGDQGDAVAREGVRNRFEVERGVA